MPTQKETAMQLQIDQLNTSFNRYMLEQAKDRSEAREERGKIFQKLDEAAEERKTILIQTTKTNGRVNGLEASQKRNDSRFRTLESDQKESIGFRGKVSYAIAFVTTVTIGAIVIWLRSH